MHVLLFSLERWDEVWRRNQHLAARLVRSGAASRVTFVEPPLLRVREASWSPEPGVEVLRPWMPIPKRFGGLRLATQDVLRRAGTVDVLWVNDPAFGVQGLGRGVPAVYDVTDDWRTFSFPSRIVRRIVRAENRLAREARTVVCSQVLADRWRQRYGVEAAVVHNGIDVAPWASVTPRALDGPGPHVGYVGTLQSDRLDVELVLAVADREEVGTVHLVGPDALDPDSRKMLRSHSGVRLEGAVPAPDVPAWMTAMNVLVSPHRINDFTMSLDAIKAREYVTSGRRIVATPTSGFQFVDGDRVTLATREGFADAVAREVEAASGKRPQALVREDWTWDARARQFSGELAQTVATATNALR